MKVQRKYEAEERSLDTKAQDPQHDEKVQQKLDTHSVTPQTQTHTQTQPQPQHSEWIHIQVPPGPLGVNMSDLALTCFGGDGRQSNAPESGWRCGVAVQAILALPGGARSPLADKVPIGAKLLKLDNEDVSDWSLHRLASYLRTTVVASRAKVPRVV